MIVPIICGIFVGILVGLVLAYLYFIHEMRKMNW